MKNKFNIHIANFLTSLIFLLLTCIILNDKSLVTFVFLNYLLIYLVIFLIAVLFLLFTKSSLAFFYYFFISILVNFYFILNGNLGIKNITLHLFIESMFYLNIPILTSSFVLFCIIRLKEKKRN